MRAAILRIMAATLISLSSLGAAQAVVEIDITQGSLKPLDRDLPKA